MTSGPVISIVRSAARPGSGSIALFYPDVHREGPQGLDVRKSMNALKHVKNYLTSGESAIDEMDPLCGHSRLHRQFVAARPTTRISPRRQHECVWTEAAGHPVPHGQRSARDPRPRVPWAAPSGIAGGSARRTSSNGWPRD
jgi:hypothetical protein